MQCHYKGDLAVVITDNLKFFIHVLNAVKKAKMVLAVLRDGHEDHQKILKSRSQSFVNASTGTAHYQYKGTDILLPYIDAIL